MLPPVRVQHRRGEARPVVERVHAAIERTPFPADCAGAAGLSCCSCALAARARSASSAASRTMMAIAVRGACSALAHLTCHRLNTHATRRRFRSVPVPLVAARAAGDHGRRRAPAGRCAAGTCRAAPWRWRCCGRWYSSSCCSSSCRTAHLGEVGGDRRLGDRRVALIGWRAAKGIAGGADVRTPGGPLAGAQPPGRPGAVPRPGGQAGPGGAGYPGAMGGHLPAQYGTRAQGVAQVYADHAAREPAGGRAAAAEAADHPRATRWPSSTR